MFFSHELLTKNQYGVATIWLVATVGTGSQQKLKRKTLQEVDIPKACEKILDPGAPLALRLQGKLLYGVTRVFAHQCNYVLSDAGKTQSDMMTFFRSTNVGETDEKAGRTTRQHIIIQDDPSFDPTVRLPELDKLLTGRDFFNLTMASTQQSADKFSQMSPLDNISLPSACSSRRSSFIGLDLPPSSLSIGSYQLPGDLGHYSSPANKGLHEPQNMSGLIPMVENDLDPICGVGLDFDADGNLVGILDEEPELPPLRGISPDPLEPASVIRLGPADVTNQGDFDLAEEPVIDLGEAAMLDADMLAEHAAGEDCNTGAPPLTTETAESGEAAAIRKVSRSRKGPALIDEEMRIPRSEFRAWTDNYAHNMEATRKPTKATTQAQARQNALAILYDNGLSNVGVWKKGSGIDHPLALDFAGPTLRAHIFGLSTDDIEDYTRPGRSRRRKSPEAFGDDNANIRNVRPRLEEDELARGNAGAFGESLDLGDDTIPEVGLEGMAALEDKHSSSFTPWSRQGSVVPGSIPRVPGSTQKSVTAPSPLHGRGSVVGSIDRHSDPVDDQRVSIRFGSQQSWIDHGQDRPAFDFDADNDTLASTQGLDISSQRFLEYVAEQAVDRGTLQVHGTVKEHWIDFEVLADPEVHDSAIAAQAFLHVLSFATKGIILVEQDGIDDMEPFGALRIGLAAQTPSRPGIATW